MPLELYCKLIRGMMFHFYDNPTRHLIKSDDNHYVDPLGLRKIHPHVAVISEVPKDPEIKKINYKKG